FCDGTRCALLDPARDYKRLRDSDQGPNTGGMGAFSPIPGIPAGFEERVRREVFEPVLAEMAARGTPFRGVLYAGIMADVQRERLWVLEFNARFGDPETQVLLPRLEGDVFPWFEACVKGDLSKLPPRVPFQKDSAVVVVAAAHGYPEHPESGRELHGKLPERIFYAGVRRSGENLTTAGGRVFGALGMAPTLREARTRAYEHLSAVSFEGMHYRTDIGGRG
ncbi:MAG: phosphoribosylamine--glycine ligase, partial [Bdellovibrionota bacterium]